MARVAPFHTKNRTDVYHNNDNCGPGAEIPKYDRIDGSVVLPAKTGHLV